MKRCLILLALFLAAEIILLANNAALDTLAWRATRWFVGDQDEFSAPKQNERAAVYVPVRGGAPARVDLADPDNPNRWDLATPSPMGGKFYKRTEKIWRIFRDFGEPQFAVILVIGVSLLDRRRWWKAGVILGVSAALAGGAGMLIRCVTGRLRPDGVMLDAATLKPLKDAAGNAIRNDGGNHWFWFRGFSFDASDLAFPSGHATAAFAAAAVLACFYPRSRYFVFTLAAFCALTRVVMQAHFFADALLGAAVGTAIGHFSAKALEKWIPDPRRPKLAENPAS